MPVPLATTDKRLPPEKDDSEQLPPIIEPPPPRDATLARRPVKAEAWLEEDCPKAFKASLQEQRVGKAVRLTRERICPARKCFMSRRLLDEEVGGSNDSPPIESRDGYE